MVKEDSVAGVDAVGLTIVYTDPIGIEFCDRVGASGIKRCGFSLWNLLNLAE